jgi:acyl-CoA thioesterase-1
VEHQLHSGALQRQSAPYGAIARFFHLLLVLGLLVLWSQAAAAREQLVLAFGDSLTAGYQLKPGEGFVPQLEAALKAKGHDVRVHNAGVSGDTTATGRARLQWVLKSLGRTPDVAIVALGANDMLRGQPVAQAEANLDAILGDLKRQGVTVVLAGMLAAPNMGPGYARQYNAMFPALARKHGTIFYPFFTEGVTANPKMLLADGMHPNAAGTKEMARRIAPSVDKALMASSRPSR